jgi:hypothetical protein
MRAMIISLQLPQSLEDSREKNYRTSLLNANSLHQLYKSLPLERKKQIASMQQEPVLTILVR